MVCVMPNIHSSPVHEHKHVCATTIVAHTHEHTLIWRTAYATPYRAVAPLGVILIGNRYVTQAREL